MYRLYFNGNRRGMCSILESEGHYTTRGIQSTNGVLLISVQSEIEGRVERQRPCKWGKVASSSYSSSSSSVVPLTYRGWMAKCICIQLTTICEWISRGSSCLGRFLPSLSLTDWVRDNDNKSRVIEYVFSCTATDGGGTRFSSFGNHHNWVYINTDQRQSEW